jgi:hypothetical protein
MKHIGIGFALVVALGTLSVVGTAYAAWNAPVTITGYYVYDTGQAYFKTASNPTGTGCTDNSYIALDTDAKNFKAIWAQVLSAYAMGSTVSVHTTGCLGPYPRAIALAVPNTW